MFFVRRRADRLAKVSFIVKSLGIPAFSSSAMSISARKMSTKCRMNVEEM
jgi:hypothetical protein